MPEAAAAGAACGGGFESTSTAATSRTAIRPRLAGEAPRKPRAATAGRARDAGATTKWWNAPQPSASATSAELDEQDVAVAGRPEVGAPGSAGTSGRRPRRGRARRAARRSGEPPNASAAAPVAARRRRELEQPAEPERRRREVHPVGEPRTRRGVGRVPGEREAGGEAEREPERRPTAAHRRSVSQARKSRAATSAKPSVITTNASPKRVPPATARGRRR